MSEPRVAELDWTQLDTVTASSWSVAELQSVDLGDQRLNRRLQATAGQLAAQPLASINQACDDWAATKASYRLFDNAKVTPAQILKPPQQCTQTRMQAYALVLALQDSAYLNSTAHPATAGLGPIGAPAQDLQGMVQHTTLAITTDGLPPPGVQVVSVCDREADVYELFVKAAELETGLLVRATQDRCPPCAKSCAGLRNWAASSAASAMANRA